MKNLVLLTLFLCLLIIGCSEDNTVAPLVNSNQEERDTTDVIYGWAWINDGYTDGQYDRLSDASGVIVTLTGKTTVYRDTTETDGLYELKGIKAGVYSVDVSKEGYKGYHIPQEQYVGNGRLQIGGFQMNPLKRRSIFSGRVEVYEQYGSGYSTDKSGVIVSVNGTNLQDTTDINGEWRIKGMEEGNFTFTVEKAGFELHPKSQLSAFFKNDTVNGTPVRLGAELIETPTTGISLSQPQIVESGDTTFLQIPFEIVNVPSGKQPNILLYIGDENVSLSDFKGKVNPLESYGSKIIDSKYVFIIRKYSSGGRIVFDTNFKSGSQVFIRAYTANPQAQIYTDPVTKEKIPVGYGQPSQVVSFFMP